MLDPVKNALDHPHGQQAIPLHYLWKELQEVQAFCDPHEKSLFALMLYLHVWQL